MGARSVVENRMRSPHPMRNALRGSDKTLFCQGRERCVTEAGGLDDALRLDPEAEFAVEQARAP